MKISQKQANLLAKEIFNQLKKQNIQQVSPLLIDKIEKFKSEKDRLEAVENEARRAIEDHDKKLKHIVGKKDLHKIRSYWDVDNIIEKLEEINTPSISEIEDKIIIKSMFASEHDMDAFVIIIMKEFTKKKFQPVNN